MRQPSSEMGGEAATSDASDELLASLGSLDLAHVLVGCLDVQSMLALGAVSTTWQGLVDTDEIAWRAQAAFLGVFDLPAGATSWRQVVERLYPLLPGDALIVKDTFNIWASARVMVKLGEYLLIHYEGWGESWFMWIHRTNDAARIRPLVAPAPGIGQHGAYNEATFHRMLATAHRRVTAQMAWPPTAGSRNGDWPHPYIRPGEVGVASRRMFTPPADAAAIAAAIATPVRAFRPLSELAADRVRRCGPNRQRHQYTHGPPHSIVRLVSTVVPPVLT